MNHPSIPAEALSWTNSGPDQDPFARLLTTIVVAGITMHLEAFALANEGDAIVDNMQAFATLPDDAEFEFAEEEAAFWKLCGDQAVQTFSYGGREYALVAYPFGD